MLTTSLFMVTIHSDAQDCDGRHSYKPRNYTMKRDCLMRAIGENAVSHADTKVEYLLSGNELRENGQAYFHSSTDEGFTSKTIDFEETVYTENEVVPTCTCEACS